MDLTDDREAVAADAGDEFEVVSPVVVAHIGNVPLPRQAQGTDVQPGSGGGGGLHHLSYHGGPLITAVEVVTIFWGAEWQQFPQNLLTFQLNGFFDYILTGPLMDVLAQYSVPGQIIGHGQRTGTATFSDTEPGGAPRRLTDDDIRQALQGWIRAGGVPAPAANTLYFIFLPPGVTVTAGPWGSCTSMCGYHSSIPGGPMYAVEPFIPCGNSCDFIGDGSALDNLTEVCSHELCEAITDPRGGGWWDDNLARQNQPAEIGDICNGIARRLNGYSIQTQWSNAANNCAVTPVVRWSSWDVPAGPRVQGDPAVAANADGRLEVVACTPDGSLADMRQEPGGNEWAGWRDAHGLIVGDPAIAANADGRLEVFGRSPSGSLVHTWQPAAGGDLGDDWEDLHGSLVSDPAVGRSADGRLNVFARTPGGTLAHIRQQPGIPGSGWSQWEDLGGCFSSRPAVAANADGRLDVFVRSPGGVVTRLTQTAPNGGWGSWQDLGAGFVGDPAAIANSDGRLEVFARSDGGAIIHASQTAPGGSFGGWDPIWGSFGSNPAAARNRDGRLECFMVGSDGTLWHAWETTPPNKLDPGEPGWSDPESLGGLLAGDPVAVTDAAGRLQVFGRAPDGTIAHIMQI